MASGDSVVRLAQAMLQQAVDRTLIIDGHWGRYTNSVYARGSAEVRRAVDAVLATAGTNSARLLAETRAKDEKMEAAAEGTIEKAVNDACRKAGVSPTVLMKFLKIENPNRDPRAVSKNGSSHGLFQIQRRTWNGVLSNNGLREPTWDQVYDVAANSLIAALLVKENATNVKNAGYKGDIDGRILYLAHQQGPRGAVEIWQRATGQAVTRPVIAGKALTDNLPRGVDPTPDAFAKYWWKRAGDVMA